MIGFLTLVESLNMGHVDIAKKMAVEVLYFLLMSKIKAAPPYFLLLMCILYMNPLWYVW